MAKQIGPLFVTGTIDNITFYLRDGVYYARKKSSLSGKRVKTHRSFKRTMENANRLAVASKIASAVYRSIPRAGKEHAMYRMFTGIAMDMLKKVNSKEQVLELMMEKYVRTERKEMANEKTGIQSQKVSPLEKSAPAKQVFSWWNDIQPVDIYIPLRNEVGLEQPLHKEFAVPWFRNN